MMMTMTKGVNDASDGAAVAVVVAASYVAAGAAVDVVVAAVGVARLRKRLRVAARI